MGEKWVLNVLDIFAQEWISSKLFCLEDHVGKK